MPRFVEAVRIIAIEDALSLFSTSRRRAAAKTHLLIPGAGPVQRGASCAGHSSPLNQCSDDSQNHVLRHTGA
jgi:hypothetical protein